MDTSQQLDLLAHTGVLLLENGAATYRVEETLQSLGGAFGLAHIGVYITATGLIIATEGPGEQVTRVRAIKRHGVDMNLLAELNHLSRQASSGAVDAGQLEGRIAALETAGRLYPVWLVIVGVAISCGIFGVLNGAGWSEMAATILSAALCAVLRMRLARSHLIPLAITVVCAFSTTAASWLFCQALACSNTSLAEISPVVQLVPGMMLVTAIVDMTTGDMLSGVARAANGVLIACGIALGMLLFLVWGLP